MKKEGIMMDQKRIKEYMEAHRQEMIDDICALVRIDSERTEAKEGKPFGDGAAEALAEGCRILEKYGFKANNCENYAIDTRLNGKDLKLDILAHLDVVPAGDGWSVTAPFEPVVKDGKIFGRGTADDKGPAIAALYAMRAIKELGLELKKDVRLILGSDEECGSSDIEYYFKKHSHAPMSISPDADFPLIFLEKGSLHSTFSAKLEPETALPRVISVHSGVKVNVVPAKAEAVVGGISAAKIRPYAEEIETKLGVSVMLTESADGSTAILVQGNGAHAASPMDGNNALTALLTLLNSLPLAETRSAELLRNAGRLFPHGDWSGEALGVKREDELSGALTLTLDLFSMDETGMSGTFDCRACVSANDENTRQVVYQKFEEAGFEHDDRPMNPPHYVPKDSELVSTLMESYASISGKTGEPLAIGGGTYVHEIENGVACGCADPSVDNHMHGPDEFVIIDQLIMSACVFADAILRLCC